MSYPKNANVKWVSETIAKGSDVEIFLKIFISLTFWHNLNDGIILCRKQVSKLGFDV